MGLLDFVKNIGKKVFSREEDAADKIKKVIEDANLIYPVQKIRIPLD